MERFSDFIKNNIGLSYPQKRWDTLKRSIILMADDQDTDPATYIQWLMASELTLKHVDILAKHLTIGETYFFRDMQLFNTIKKTILPSLMKTRVGKNQSMHFWSAGCCTGEEPYSLAMLLDRSLPERFQWDIKIMATDINSIFLKKARQGIYTDWSFRDAPAWCKEQYFKQNKKKFEILPVIREMINFKQLNLIQEIDASWIDLIFCRNVLMYFAPELREQVITRLYHALSPQGWLVVSPSETTFVNHPGFEFVRLPGVILFRKKKKAST